MVKALRFKGEKKVKKRKRTAADASADPDVASGDEAGPSTKKPALGDKAEANPDEDDDEGWVDADCLEDISGPLMLTILAPTPVCLAVDPTTGSTFTTLLSATSLSSTEPTSVHQVWVATKIHGTDKYSLKSAHGRYMGVDKVGVVSATREAISAEEEFDVALLEGGRWALCSVRGGWVGVQEKDGGKAVVRGDAEKVGFGEEWMVRVQRRNKKKKKAGKEGRTKDRVSRKELEELAGVKLDDDQVKVLKKARKEGGFHEALLDLRVKHGKHDKFAY